MSKRIDLGSVTSYAMAVEAGYTGTEAEWVAAIVQAAQVKEQADSNANAITDLTQSVSALQETQTAQEQEIAKRFASEVVTSLPETPAEDTIYYLPSEDSTENEPLYLAYIWLDKWAQIGGSGSGGVDETVLENYYTKTEITELLSKVTVDLSDYYTKAQVDELLETVPAEADVEKNTSDIAALTEQLAAVGVSIQSVVGEDGTTRQYLVDSEGNPLGDAIVGTGGSGSSSSTSIITVTLGTNPSSVEYGKACKFSFWWTSEYSDGGTTGNGTIVFSVKSGTTTTVCATKTMAQAPSTGDPITFDFGPYLRSGSNTLILQITDSEGNTASRRNTVTAQTLGLEVDYDWSTVNSGDASVRWRVSGSSGVTLHATLANAPVATVSNPTVGRWQTLTVEHQEHGAYRLRLWTTLDMDDGTTITSSITGFDLLFADEGSTKVLIASDFSTEDAVQQYTAQTIQYFVYDPQNEVIDVTRLEDGEVYATDSSVGREMQEWKWKPTESGEHTVSVQAGTGDNQTTRNFIVTVTAADIPNSVKEVASYAMKFNPSGHQNSDTDPLAGICKDSSGKEIACSVNDTFDWTNGGIQYDSLGNAYFCVCPGDTLTIAYQPFAADCKAAGRHIKLCFNTTSVSDRQAEWLSCKDTATNGNSVGLVMTPIQATISSENQSLSTRYMYDRGEYFDLPEVEMDINIQKTGEERLVQFWMEGCPAQVVQYTADDGWAQNDAANLVFGSEDCEVHLYLVKIAENSWEEEETFDDWIMNAPSGEEMVARYERNNIYDSMTGQIDINALPDDLVKAVWKGDRITTGKKDTVTGTLDYYHNNTHWTANDCEQKGQGTSSAGYGEAALNWDVEYVNGITYEDGTTAEGYAMSDGDVAVSYNNIKLNVASSENYKNMIGALDYQDYQPYIRPSREANPACRDTMEFLPCVVLYTNDTSDTVTAGATSYAPGETGLYGLGNFGNSKKNFAALGEGTMEEYAETECLVECSENTSVYQLMHEILPASDSDAFDGGTGYEFRYPKSPTSAMMQSFRDLVKWVVSTCTESDYITGEALETPYVVPDGEVSYVTKSNGEVQTVYDSQSRARKVVATSRYDTETLTVDGEQYTVLPLDDDGNEVCHFSTDTEAYRLEKFRLEFEDHFIFDSMAYHYLFTHQFCMIDNRAKNTFYGTEDGVHWHLVFGYDFDTAMGNNNSGGLTLDYGLEDTDILGEKYVFNGAKHTIWVNMRKLYDRTSEHFNSEWYERIRTIFQTCESAGLWSAKRRMKLIQEKVSLIPEALWRDDARKKYLNPLTNKNSTAYLSMCNGNCLDQVCQFLVEQEQYMHSMWQSSAGRENLVTIRGYTPENYAEGYAPSSKIELTAFSKGYLTVDYDGDLQTPVRLSPGESAAFEQENVRLNDTPVYIPSAQLVAQISSVSRLYPAFCNFDSLTNCTRLEVGEGGDYSNGNMTALSVGNCAKLRYLDVRGTPNLTASIDTTGSRELRTLLAQNSGSTGASFAKGGKLETYHGGSSVTTLTAQDLNFVQDYDLEGYEKVSRVRIEDSPAIDTAEIMEQAENASRIRLTGISWNLTDTDLLNRLYTLRGLDVSGNDTDRAVLTGTCYIARAKKSELAKYAAAWPLLEITCGEEVEEYTVSYYDDAGETLLYSEAYEDGAAWVDPVASGAMSTPTKESEERTDYIYAGWDSTPTTITENISLKATFTEQTMVVVTWLQSDGTTVIHTKRVESGWRYVDPVTSGEIDTPTLESTVEYTYTYAGWDYTPSTVTEDISIYATYTRTTRKYTVRWHSYGGATLYTLTAVVHSSLEYSGDTQITRPASGDTTYLWLGEWDQDTTDVTSDLDCYPVFIECVLPTVTQVPSGYYIYSDDPTDNMVYTKEEFAAIVLSDNTKDYLAVNDKIKMCLSSSEIADTEIVFTLHAFNHHRLAEDTENFAATTWYAIGALNAGRSMNSSNTNVGGWPSALLRTWLQETLYPTLPMFWRALIQKVQVMSSAGGTSSDIVSSDDYLHLMSQAEVGFNTTETPYCNEVDAGAENVTFTCYTDNNSRIKKTYNGTGSAQNWWLRSPQATGSSAFAYVYNFGYNYSNTATNTYGVVPGFSI